MSQRLILLARVPQPGRVKTRLSPALGSDGAASLYEALLDDTVARLRQVGVPMEIHAAGGPEAVEWFRSRFPRLRARFQQGEGLGARLEAAFRRSFRRGCNRIIAVGSDHPTLPPEYLSRGFELLEVRDVVLGPGLDGGYYAVGIRGAAWPTAEVLFRGIPWSTAGVLEATREAAHDSGLEVEELPEWYDVDRPTDLRRLVEDAGPSSRSLRVLRALSVKG